MEQVIKGNDKSGKIFNSLQAAIDGAAQEGSGKCWAVIQAAGGVSVQDVHAALKDGGGRLAVALEACTPSDQTEALRALEYGACYVAAAAVDGPSAASVVQDAASFSDGPSFVILWSKDAVQGDWTTFSSDPRREAAGGSAFVQESSAAVRKEIQTFLDNDNLLTLIAKKTLASAGGGEDGGEDGGGGGSASKTVTILYSSDTGHGQECAKAIARECRNGGFSGSAVKCVTMDSFNVGELAKEALVVFCVATAGKGEMCGNGRSFWNQINDRADDLKGTLGDMKYAMFGLGDSHYWGKGTEDSRINFAKPARDLDEVLEKIGAPRLFAMGYGDDQDVDQYHTGFGEWKTQLYSRLGIESSAGGGGDADEGASKSDEVIKVETKQLRGSLKKSLDDVTTGKIPYQDTRLMKSHGGYQQDDRDLREERKNLGLENAFSFKIRVRIPGGCCTPEQWMAMDDICDKYANGMKITRRQTWQLHGVAKRDVKDTMRAMNRVGMDTLATCGDVCRNVMCTSDPSVCSAETMDAIMRCTYAIHNHCLPRSGAYHEIFLMSGEDMAEKTQVLDGMPVEEEPLYGLTYLPRQYKVAVAIPPSNDVDVFAHCCGFIAIIEGGKLQGFNVTVGGGLGLNDGKTNPRLADVIGFCKPSDAKYVCECAMVVSRDYGDRTGKSKSKDSKEKDTLEDYGKRWYLEQVNNRLGFKLEPARPYKFTRHGDLYDWTKTEDGLWHCGLHIRSGRVKGQTRVGLRKIAETLKGTSGTLRMTCNQQVVLTNVTESKKAAVQALLTEYQVAHTKDTKEKESQQSGSEDSSEPEDETPVEASA